MSSDAGRWPKYRMICGAYKETSFFSSSGVPINIAYTHTHGPYSWRQVLGQQSIFSCSSLLVRKRFFEKKKTRSSPLQVFPRWKEAVVVCPSHFLSWGDQTACRLFARRRHLGPNGHVALKRKNSFFFGPPQTVVCKTSESARMKETV